jgi:soluble lytic murein transglycosylase-like protein
MLWEERIVDWAQTSGLSPELVAAVMQVESCGDPQALSRSGARGLFQVMPFHFVEGEDPYDPETNARRGLDYLAEALALADQDIGLAAAGYNGGHGIIGLPESNWPEETVRYRNWVRGIYNDATSGAASSPTLEAWLGAGGANLCNTAARRLAHQP